MPARRTRFPNKYVVMGVSTLIVGLLLLLFTAADLERPLALWPLALVVSGLVLLYFRVFRSGPDSYLFLGISILLSGVLLIVTRLVVHLELATIWPTFMTISGTSLLGYGLRKRGTSRLSLVIPGVAAVLLSLIFLPFSLGLVQRSFADFVSDWWPLVIVIMGIVLLIVHFVHVRPEIKRE